MIYEFLLAVANVSRAIVVFIGLATGLREAWTTPERISFYARILRQVPSRLAGTVKIKPSANSRRKLLRTRVANEDRK